jgi:hypothetical protein
MKQFKHAFLLLALSLIIFSCKKTEEKKTDPQPDYTITQNSKGQYEVRGNITSDLTLDSAKRYLLFGYVRVKSPAILTIMPGTIIKGDYSTKGTLIIDQGGKIMAEGTAAHPIVFTSNANAGTRGPGNWGGVVICGKAPTNAGTTLTSTSLTADLEGGYGATYGGSDPNDNSGVLKYVRIEFAGIALQPNQEINGLTLGGVGAGTTIDYVQVSYSGDDSYEWFGGTVNCKHLIAYRGWDDDFDTDNGYSGSVQFAVALREPATADQSGSNGFESDNNANGDAVSPYTSATFSNVTILGPLKDASVAAYSPLFKRAAHIRRNSKLKVRNCILAGFPVGVLVDGTAAEANATADALQVKNTIVSGCMPTNSNGTALAVNSGSTFDIAAWFDAAAMGNDRANYIVPTTSLGLANGFNTTTAPDFRPQGTLISADFTGVPTFITPVNYIGAFDATNDWTAGWANFAPQTTAY